MEFRELADLRLFLRELRDRQVESLTVYYDKESVLSLIATNQWLSGPWAGTTAKLVNGLLMNSWESAGLPENNIFTVAFVLEAVTELRRVESSIVLDEKCKERLAQAQRILKDAVSRDSVRLQGYPPTAYITQLAVRTLKKQSSEDVDPAGRISGWAEREVNKQIALLSRNDRTADVFQLAYAVILLKANA